MFSNSLGNLGVSLDWFYMGTLFKKKKDKWANEMWTTFVFTDLHIPNGGTLSITSPLREQT